MSLEKLLRKYKTALYPTLGIIVTIFLSILTLNIFWQKVSELRSKIATNESQKEVLDERLATLQNVVVEARESSSLVAFALPDTSPAVFVLNHINNLVESNELILDNLSVNSSENVDETVTVNKVNVSFELEGNYASVYKFMSDISSVIPLVNLDSLDIDTQSNNSVLARVSLSGFYAPFPTELPPLTSPLDDFTNEEKSTVNFLETFVRPELSNTSVTAEDGQKGRLNPFEEI